jgi:uncharacterized protein YecT (DUF1311 family)
VKLQQNIDVAETTTKLRNMFGKAALIALALGLWLPETLFGQAHFKRFPETVTNDGTYVLGWGLKDDPDGPPESKTEIIADGEQKIDVGEGSFDTTESIEDYLVDTATAKIVATIPEFYYYAGSEGQENHCHLEVGWSPDNRGGIAVYEGRYATDKIAWINPANHKAKDVTEPIEKVLRRVAIGKKGKSAAEDQISVGNPVFVRPRRLVLGVTMGALSSKREDAVSYAFEVVLNVKGNLDAPQFEVSTVKWASKDSESESSSGNEDDEAQLNRVYHKLAGSLSAPDRESLKQEQLKWLATREHITAAEKDEKEMTQLEFTRRRIAELETRLRFR